MDELLDKVQCSKKEMLEGLKLIGKLYFSSKLFFAGTYILGALMHNCLGLRISKLISVFQNLPNVSTKQLCALAHLGCTHEAGTS